MTKSIDVLTADEARKLSQRSTALRAENEFLNKVLSKVSQEARSGSGKTYVYDPFKGLNVTDAHKEIIIKLMKDRGFRYTPPSYNERDGRDEESFSW